MMSRTTIFPALVALLCMSGVENVGAQAKKADAETLTARKVSRETIGAWSVECSEVRGQKKRCNLSQRLVQAKTRRSIAGWVISSSKDKVIAAVTIPAGVSVPAGLTVTIGKSKPHKVQYSTCLKSSCVASFELTEVHLNDMSAGGEAVFTADSLSQKKINIQFSLKGFSEAFKIYRSETG